MTRYVRHMFSFLLGLVIAVILHYTWHCSA